ncbi:MAG: type II restriction endonuclease [Alphaproteobacteria bacterium]
MALADVTDWISEFGRPGNIWYAKRLSANDTLATGSHQAGLYIQKEFLFRIFPSLVRTDAINPDINFDLYIDSHVDHQKARAIWYNNKMWGGTRNETRLTRFGGQQSALRDPDSTGALAVFVFAPVAQDTTMECHVWVCQAPIEEDLFEERLGPVEPKSHVIWIPGSEPSAVLPNVTAGQRDSCCMSEQEIPRAWLEKLPTGEEIIRKTLELSPAHGVNPDMRLLKRRRCEYEIFQSVEQVIFLPRIQIRFETITDFIRLAQKILQSRKSRSGNSLELHARAIMTEEGLRPEADFSYRPVIEGGKEPDFLFPSKSAYDDATFPVGRLRMLAVKTSCKDRWRQVINEANRIPVKHLLTLQEGVSEGQFREMREAGVHLVVPSGLHTSYPKSIRPHLVSFESFIGDVRLLNLPA